MHADASTSAHHEHEEGAGDHDPEEKGAEHMECQHGLVALASAPVSFVPVISETAAVRDEVSPRLPAANVRKVEQPPRAV
jgi:hypothetical protein